MKKELEIFNRLTSLLLKNESLEPVIKPLQAKEINKTLDIVLEDYPISETYFEEILEDLILTTPRTNTKLFFNQLFGGRNTKATLGDLLAVMLNNSMYTYKVAGPQVGIEKEIINKVCEIIKYPQNSGGTITSGGSISNLIAMLMARDKTNPEIRKDGINEILCSYTSEASHYSIQKNAAISGIGIDQVRTISTDEKGLLIPELLEESIKNDIKNKCKPFFINATAGTTVLGAFDPLEEISEIAKKYNIWLHVDGAYCGSVIFSNNYKYLVKGIENADSFNFNAHKMMGTPLTCSVLVTQNKKYLYDSLSVNADYLYQTDEDDYNLGKTSLQCGRRNNALKFWALWKSVGTKGLETIINKQFYLADIARDYIIEHPDYTLHSFNDSISVCFSYKNIDAETLCKKLYEEGELMVSFGKFRNTTFIRLVTINYGNSKKEILNFFNVIEEFVSRNKTLVKPLVLQE